MSAIRVEALAKINLGLRVLYRRPDNFHELRTVFQTISLADRIDLQYRRSGGPAIELTCNRAELSGLHNLAARAARRLLEATGNIGRVSLQLEKRIPVGAGLGGGSSDAAAVLWALGSLLRPLPPRELLFHLAAELGSDVPYFLLGGRALGVGRGTEVYPLADSPARWLLVVAPSIAVSTAEAYRRLAPHLTSSRWEDKIDRFCSVICVPEQGPARDFKLDPENDFEAVVFRLYPELERLKARLGELGARPALLCGSGSALFGLFADRRQALRARDSFDLDDGDRFVVKTVGRADYQTRWRGWLDNKSTGR
ncbi:MAG: 4-(cytidine 5'-diphospho)-2-C-methyl-D-erythritol kinase [Acidobacteria bacterium]|nr:4-(cytidine 5'-diphospho)-2-C-methyl-D-erythritol kinase [Acidobacteriota bacterium]